MAETYYPTGPNSRSNAYYARTNHTRLARCDRNRSEFLGTVGGEPGTVPLTGYVLKSTGVNAYGLIQAPAPFTPSTSFEIELDIWMPVGYDPGSAIQGLVGFGSSPFTGNAAATFLTTRVNGPSDDFRGRYNIGGTIPSINCGEYLIEEWMNLRFVGDANGAEIYFNGVLAESNGDAFAPSGTQQNVYFLGSGNSDGSTDLYIKDITMRIDGTLVVDVPVQESDPGTTIPNSGTWADGTVTSSAMWVDVTGLGM